MALNNLNLTDSDDLHFNSVNHHQLLEPNDIPHTQLGHHALTCTFDGKKPSL